MNVELAHARGVEDGEKLDGSSLRPHRPTVGLSAFSLNSRDI